MCNLVICTGVTEEEENFLYETRLTKQTMTYMSSRILILTFHALINGRPLEKFDAMFGSQKHPLSQGTIVDISNGSHR